MKPLEEEIEDADPKIIVEDDEWFVETEDRKTIKTCSPFTIQFVKIEKETELDNSPSLT